MPNYVKNKISFQSDSASEILGVIAPDGYIDFNTLIPCPLHIYQGHLSGEDEDDFGGNTWMEWSRANWGVKWNAETSVIENDGKSVSITFTTAWSKPYPFIIAFANRFKLNFKYEYVCESREWWGTEEWTCDVEFGTPRSWRLSKSEGVDSEWEAIYTSVYGRSPNIEE